MESQMMCSEFFGEKVSPIAYKEILNNHQNYIEYKQNIAKIRKRTKAYHLDAIQKLDAMWKQKSKINSRSKKRTIYPRNNWISQKEVDEMQLFSFSSRPENQPVQYFRDHKKRPILIGGEGQIRHSASQEKKSRTTGFPVDWAPKVETINQSADVPLRFIGYKNHCFVFEWKDSNREEKLQLTDLNQLLQKVNVFWNLKETQEFSECYPPQTPINVDWRVFYENKWTKMNDFMKEYFGSIKRQSEKIRLLSPLESLTPTKTKKKSVAIKNVIKAKEEKEIAIEQKEPDIIDEKTKLIQMLAGKIQSAASCLTEKDIQSWKIELKRDLKL